MLTGKDRLASLCTAYKREDDRVAGNAITGRAGKKVLRRMPSVQRLSRTLIGMASSSRETQPIALPVHVGLDDGDYAMLSPPQSGSFNPASYQRSHFLGSPISWRAGSFGNRYIPSQSPTAMLLNGFDPMTKGSVESDRGSILNAFNIFNADPLPTAEGDFARNYSCCGVQLNDLHALLEHFEEVHIVRQPQQQFDGSINVAVPFNPVPTIANPNPAAYALYQQHQQQSQHMYSQQMHQTQPQQYANGFDTDDMDLGDDHDLQQPPQQQQHSMYQVQHVSSHSSPDSGSSGTPPDTPVISTPSSAYAHPHQQYGYPHPMQYHQNLHHVHYPTPLKSTSSTLDGALGENPELHSLNSGSTSSKPSSPTKCVTPSLLFGIDGHPIHGVYPSDSSSQLVNNRVSKSMPGSPLATTPPPLPTVEGTASVGKKKRPSAAHAVTSVSALSGAKTEPNSPAVPSSNTSDEKQQPNAPGSLANLSTATLATLSGLTSSKPFKCPKPGCNKSYKQANGLKYHMTHGSCVFAPPREVEQVRAIIGERAAAAEHSAAATPHEGHSPSDEHPESLQAAKDGLNLSESELRDLEKEAERRLRPFACGIGDCSRRYKNMNGLRYHYQHSGDHGAIGLALLAGGVHECLTQPQQGPATVERGRARSGERGVSSTKKDRSKSNKKDGLSSSAAASRAGSRNVSRVGTPVPAVPSMTPAHPQPPPQLQITPGPGPSGSGSGQEKLALSMPYTVNGNAYPKQQQQGSAPTSPLHLSPVQTSPQGQGAGQTSPLAQQMSQLGVHSAPASPLSQQGFNVPLTSQHVQQHHQGMGAQQMYAAATQQQQHGMS